MGWVRVPDSFGTAKFRGLDRHLFGVPYQLGPRLFVPENSGGTVSYFSAWSLAPGGGVVRCTPANATHFNGEPFPTKIVTDGKWHHISMSENRTVHEVMIDGYLITQCFAAAGAITPIPGAIATLNFGLYDLAIGSANFGAYGGYMYVTHTHARARLQLLHSSQFL